MRHLILILALAASPACAQTLIYKWVDGKGRTHYGEHPPMGITATPLRPLDPPEVTAPPEDLAAQERDFRRRHIERRREEERQANQLQLDRKRCGQVKEELALAEGVNRLYRFEKGEKVYLDSEQHRAELEELRAQGARYCR